MNYPPVDSETSSFNFPIERSFSEHLQRHAHAIDAFEAWTEHTRLAHLSVSQRATLFAVRCANDLRGVSAAFLVEHYNGRRL